MSPIVLSLLSLEERTRCGLEDPNNPILRFAYHRNADGVTFEMLPGHLPGSAFARILSTEGFDALPLDVAHVLTITRTEVTLTVDGAVQRTLDSVGNQLIAKGHVHTWVDPIAQTLAQLPTAEGLETAVVVALARQLPMIYASGGGNLLRPGAMRIKVVCATCAERERKMQGSGVTLFTGRKRASIGELELAYGAHCNMSFPDIAYDIVRMAAEPILRRRERDVFRDFASDLQRTADAVLESLGEVPKS